MHYLVKPVNIFILLLFLLIGVEIVKDLTSPYKTVNKRTKEIREVRFSMLVNNESQGNYRLRQNKFAKTFDELNTNFPKGGSTTTGRVSASQNVAKDTDYWRGLWVKISEYT
jgi:hypothetical protein